MAVEQHYFSASPLKICSESCDHFDALDKLPLEGFKSICKIAAGSDNGVGFGLRAIGCIPSHGIKLQELQRQDRQRGRLMRAIESKAPSANPSKLSVQNYFQTQIERALHAHKLRKPSLGIAIYS